MHQIRQPLRGLFFIVLSFIFLNFFSHGLRAYLRIIHLEDLSSFRPLCAWWSFRRPVIIPAALCLVAAKFVHGGKEKRCDFLKAE